MKDIIAGNYTICGEADRETKAMAWQTAIGLQDVDALFTSAYLLDTAQKNIEGVITTAEARSLIYQYYDRRHDSGNRIEEADKVSVNSVILLLEPTFAFNYAGLTAIHRHLFEGVYDSAGMIRNYNVTRKERVLAGDTVFFVSSQDIETAAEYEFYREKNFDYGNLSTKEITEHIAEFIASLWQIHPYAEGNTRTSAIFTIKYLRSLGFKVNTELFSRHSWYFHNALVRANYQNMRKGISRNYSFLYKFFYNLVLNERNELKDETINIDYSVDISAREKLTERTTTVQHTEQVNKLIININNNKCTTKEMMKLVGLKHRPTFITNYLTPAITGGYVVLLYPDRPNHPKQKYLLSDKGVKLLEEILE